ncbi:Pyruvate/Phosphoenolpyruvate kinase domain-containing protein [Salix suchowensis]|nr:Pyruvate/Phosphoenolpyruvate kinase domain-containing protein [Salix suchowensis]
MSPALDYFSKTSGAMDTNPTPAAEDDSTKSIHTNTSGNYYNPRLDPKNYLEGPLSDNPAHASVRCSRVRVTPGICDGISARCALEAGFNCLYQSGAATTASRMVRIDGLQPRPVIADADTGFGGPTMVARTVTQYARCGAAGLHIEDQSWGWRRLSSGVKLAAAAGADVCFIEGVKSKDLLEKTVAALAPKPVLVNVISGGLTPPFTYKDAEEMGAKIISTSILGFPTTQLLSSCSLLIVSCVAMVHACRVAMQSLKKTGTDFVSAQGMDPKAFFEVMGKLRLTILVVLAKVNPISKGLDPVIEMDAKAGGSAFSVENRDTADSTAHNLDQQRAQEAVNALSWNLLRAKVASASSLADPSSHSKLLSGYAKQLADLIGAPSSLHPNGAIPPSVLDAAPHLAKLVSDTSDPLLEATWKLREAYATDKAIDSIIDLLQRQHMHEPVARSIWRISYKINMSTSRSSMRQSFQDMIIVTKLRNSSADMLLSRKTMSTSAALLVMKQIGYAALCQVTFRLDDRSKMDMPLYVQIFQGSPLAAAKNKRPLAQTLRPLRRSVLSLFASIGTLATARTHAQISVGMGFALSAGQAQGPGRR